MDNILYKAFGKRIYKALLNLVGGGNSGGDSTSQDVKTLIVDISGDVGPILARDSDKAIFTSISQEVIDALADNPEDLNFLEEVIARQKLISNFVIECLNNNKFPQVYYRTHTDENNHAICNWLSTLFEAIRYNYSFSVDAEGIALIDRGSTYIYGIISGTYEGNKFIASNVPITTEDIG